MALTPATKPRGKGRDTAPAADRVAYYRAGQCRNSDDALTHTYAEMEDGELWPMCGYGWNRSGGHRFSIFRGSPGTQGDCLICRRRVAQGLPPIKQGFDHKTRWL